jgi:hypothetical protein
MLTMENPVNTSRWVQGFAVVSSKGPASLEGHNLSFTDAFNRYGLDMNLDASRDVVRRAGL